jgi:hypothetical protein
LRTDSQKEDIFKKKKKFKNNKMEEVSIVAEIHETDEEEDKDSRFKLTANADDELSDSDSEDLNHKELTTFQTRKKLYIKKLILSLLSLDVRCRILINVIRVQMIVVTVWSF